MRIGSIAGAAGAAALAAVTLAACGGSSGGNNNSGDFCTQAAQTVAQFSQISSEFQNTTQTPSVDSIKQLIASADTAFDSLDSNAPSAIASSFHTLRSAFDQASTQVQSTSTFDQMANAFDGLNSPNVQSASTQVDNYLQSTCHINPSATPT
ncbi:MAG: hypothetical protein JOZ92_04560 [Candidatus Dormibacteraeota bacterium]|nr:hypothetical protein [Candidatus Dormibacteraeota bacterium]